MMKKSAQYLWRQFYKKNKLTHEKIKLILQMGLYFAWMGFYNTMLVPAALVGSLVFIYGVSTNYLDQYNVERWDPSMLSRVNHRDTWFIFEKKARN
jgi:hypothetical protein